MHCSERSVTDAILANLRGCARDALAVLGRAGEPLTTAAERVAAADAFVDRWQQGDRPAAAAVDAEDVPYLFGSLWGEAVVEEFGWAWAQVVFHRHQDVMATAVVSPDRSMAIFPVHFVLGCLRDPAVDCTMALSFHLLAGGKLEGFQPGGYAHVMDAVHRIVPRR